MACETAAGREEFGRGMERRRGEETGGQEWQRLKRGWVLGSEGFRARLLEAMEWRLAADNRRKGFPDHPKGGPANLHSSKSPL